MKIINIFQTPDVEKLLKSFLIVASSTAILLSLKYLFPSFNWISTETIFLTSVSAWVVNTVQEAIKTEK